MTTTPDPNPMSKRTRELLVGFVIGGLSILAVAIVAFPATGGPGTPPPRPAPSAGATAAYPSAPPPGSLEARRPAPAVVVRPGFLLDDSERTRSFEAVLRLHTWLGLRDLRTGTAYLEWVPPLDGATLEEQIARDCEADGLDALEARSFASPPAAPGTAARPRDTLIIRIALGTDAQELRVEGIACTPGGRIHRQVIKDQPDRIARTQRELLTWLASRLGVADTLAWEEDWGRSPAPAGPVRAGYARALRASMDDTATAPDALEEAGGVLPEAAWLLSRLDPSAARAHLIRAAALRVGFTAALEDLASLQVAEGSAELADATLQRLRRLAPGSRAVEWGLAWTSLQAGRAEDAARLLDQLPEWLVAEETTARLWAEILAELGEYEAALQWIEAWVAADPQSGRAQLLRGEVLAGLDREESSADAYAKAAELDPKLREPALRRWAVLGFASGSEAEVAARFAEEEWIESRPPILELRAFAASRAGAAADAARDYSRLVDLEPDVLRHRFNRCATSLAAGLVPARPDPCEGLDTSLLRSNLLAAAALSRIPERTVEQFLELMDRAELAGEQAPLDPVAADAVLLIAGPFRTEDEQERLQAKWRIAVGGERRLTASTEPEEGTLELPPLR